MRVATGWSDSFGALSSESAVGIFEGDILTHCQQLSLKNGDLFLIPKKLPSVTNIQATIFLSNDKLGFENDFTNYSKESFMDKVPLKFLLQINYRAIGESDHLNPQLFHVLYDDLNWQAWVVIWHCEQCSRPLGYGDCPIYSRWDIGLIVSI